MPSSEERKLVTVLLADLAGSTELATRHGPEQLRALLSAFFEEMAREVRAFGGTVEKYAGDDGEADAAFRQRLDILEEIQSQPELAQTLLAYGRFALSEDAPRGRALIQQASGSSGAWARRAGSRKRTQH